MDLKRYKIGPIERRQGGSVYCEMREHKDGVWVKLPDVVDMLGDIYSDVESLTSGTLDSIWCDYPFP